ncbi:Peroxisomal membrane signal receptor PTS1 [Gaertneriomyces sp. JEL0708]|nr:Peroxisomal membrane signal receptor PTS1 [Gaertneriomyces sp. JEL0708]
MDALINGATCSTGNSLSTFVKQVDRQQAFEQDLVRTGNGDALSHEAHLRERGRRPEFDDAFVNEFLNGPPPPQAVQDAFFGSGAGPSELTQALESQIHPSGDWTSEFSNFEFRPDHALEHPDFEAAFERAQLNDGGREWGSEFLRNDTLGRVDVKEFGSELEDAFTREFALIAESLVKEAQPKGKEYINYEEFKNFDLETRTIKADGQEEEEISWSNQFAKEFNGSDEDLQRLDSLFKNFNLEGMDTVKDWEAEYEDYSTGRDDDGGVLEPDPVIAPCAPYTFEVVNPYLSHPSPLDEGLKLLREDGNLTSAALALEAAVQRAPDDSEAWALLGIAQAENEKEIPAIAALQHSVQANPGNLNALMALAVSYTNESREVEAYATLKRWLETQYPDVAAMNGNGNMNATLDTTELHAQVTSMYLSAARMGASHALHAPESVTSSPESIDPDVQTGLGILFYNSLDYSKAIDCFTSALSARPDSYQLWNRLGATLANSGRSEEAIDAYYKALEIRPGYVRARYNLGVSCVNVGCYKEAAEHLLAAVEMSRGVEATGQNASGSEATGGEVNVSRNLWETLRRTFILMDRRDLADQAVPGQDLSTFKKEFEF